MNWNVFTRKAMIWPVLAVVFILCVVIGFSIRALIYVILGGDLDDMSESSMRYTAIISYSIAIAVCSALLPILRKRFIGTKYPLRRTEIRPKDLSVGDIITFPDKRECYYEGYYDGYYLFAPKKESCSEDEYIKLNKEQIHKFVRRVSNPEFGLKWESPYFSDKTVMKTE